jgi:hypothetical protein
MEYLIIGAALGVFRGLLYLVSCFALHGRIVGQTVLEIILIIAAMAMCWPVWIAYWVCFILYHICKAPLTERVLQSMPDTFIGQLISAFIAVTMGLITYYLFFKVVLLNIWLS